MKTLAERIADAIHAWAEDWGMDLPSEDAAIEIVSVLQEVLSAWQSTPEEDE